MSPRARFGSILLLLTTVGLLAGAAEFALRKVRPYEEQRRMYMRTRSVFQYERENVVFDPTLGFFHRPDLDVMFANLEFATRVRTNRQGFRDDDASLEDPEILVLGDSYAFGWGVEQHETLEAELERRLGRRALNLAVAGYGTTQELLQLQRWAQDHDLRGRTAVIQFYGNDLSAAEKEVGGVFPATLVGPDGVTFSPAEETAFDAMLARNTAAMSPHWMRHSHLADMAHEGWRRVRAKLGRMRGGVAAGGGEPTAGIDPRVTTEGRAAPNAAGTIPAGGAPGASLPPGTRLADDPFATVVAETARFAAAESLAVVFVYVPSVRHYEGSSDYDEKAFAAFRTAMEGAGLPWVDLRPVLTREDYYRLDDHWRPSGHTKAGEAIAGFLQQTPSD